MVYVKKNKGFSKGFQSKVVLNASNEKEILGVLAKKQELFFSMILFWTTGAINAIS